MHKRPIYPLLKCLEGEEFTYAILKVNEGIVGKLPSDRELVKKIEEQDIIGDPWYKTSGNT